MLKVIELKKVSSCKNASKQGVIEPVKDDEKYVTNPPSKVCSARSKKSKPSHCMIKNTEYKEKTWKMLFWSIYLNVKLIQDFK